MFRKIRFVVEEDDGRRYLVTNYRKVNGILQISFSGCWKFPLKKRRAA